MSTGYCCTILVKTGHCCTGLVNTGHCLFFALQKVSRGCSVLQLLIDFTTTNATYTRYSFCLSLLSHLSFFLSHTLSSYISLFSSTLYFLLFLTSPFHCLASLCLVFSVRYYFSSPRPIFSFSDLVLFLFVVHNVLSSF